MNHDNISILVSRICSKKLLFIADNTHYVLHAPDAETRYLSDIYYEEVWDNNKYDDWILQENINNLLNFLGVWNQQKEEHLKTLVKQIESLKLQMFLERIKSDSVKKIRQQLRHKKNFYEELMNQKTSMDYLTLENFCNARKNEFIIINTLKYRKDDRLVFNDFDDIDYKKFQDITNQIAHNFISIETYKNIAKSEIWRNIWNSNKSYVFEGPACDFSEEQKTLIGLTLMYDRIYEHPECPDQEVIDDDDMLDGWMIHQRQKNEESKKENNSQQLTNKHKNAGEIFVVSDKKDAAAVTAMNSAESLKKIRERSKVIDSHQEINEFNLPDVQRSIKLRENTIEKKARR